MSYGPEFWLYDTLIKMIFFLLTPQTTQIFAQVAKLLEDEKRP